MLNLFFKNNRDTILAGIVVLSAALIIGAATLIFLPYGIDWSMYFRPAARAMLSGESPFSVFGFYNPPWALLPLLPLALLPESLGRALLFLISFGSLILIIRRLGARGPLGMTAFLVSLPVAVGLFNGNIDWLVMLGFLFPPSIGMIFMCLKPQVGAAVIFFWCVEAFRRGGIREVLRISAPLCILFAVSLLVYGWWPAEFSTALDQRHGAFNYLTWPLSIPFGLAFLALSIKRRDIRWAMPASPCLMPHAMFHSWVVALAALARNPRAMAVASAASWLVPVVLSILQMQK
jgi:hypothetical protein